MLKRFFLLLLSVLTLLLIWPNITLANGFNLSGYCNNASNSAVCVNSTTNTNQNPISLKIADIINIIIEVAGAIAVIIIIISAIRYAFAFGDSNRVNSARNGIFYTLIGLVVIIVAKIIIDFVINSLHK